MFLQRMSSYFGLKQFSLDSIGLRCENARPDTDTSPFRGNLPAQVDMQKKMQEMYAPKKA